MEEARRACAVSSQGSEQQGPAAAYYQKAEVHRLRGEFAEAEESYRQASRQGCEPLPGLALLRLSQGRTEAAVTTIRRALGTTTDRLRRTKLLPACVEIMLASGDLASARDACRELGESADRFQTTVLQAMANQAAGAVALAAGDLQSALPALRRAFELWLQVEAPYLAARTRALIGLACRALGDEEGATLEFAAAREAFEELGAAPDIARIDPTAPLSTALRGSGLTRRELQVLRLVATGKQNKVIAAELCLSEKTIDRHLSNIFDKHSGSSRQILIRLVPVESSAAQPSSWALTIAKPPPHTPQSSRPLSRYLRRCGVQGAVVGVLAREISTSQIIADWCLRLAEGRKAHEHELVAPAPSLTALNHARPPVRRTAAGVSRPPAYRARAASSRRATAGPPTRSLARCGAGA
jgi:DNA-binding CsgD family transcriptional regulator